jgi:hypothetical protein
MSSHDRQFIGNIHAGLRRAILSNDDIAAAAIHSKGEGGRIPGAERATARRMRPFARSA